MEDLLRSINIDWDSDNAGEFAILLDVALEGKCTTSRSEKINRMPGSRVPRSKSQYNL